MAIRILQMIYKFYRFLPCVEDIYPGLNDTPGWPRQPRTFDNNERGGDSILRRSRELGARARGDEEIAMVERKFNQVGRRSLSRFIPSA
jgi:hypothetical protein